MLTPKYLGRYLVTKAFLSKLETNPALNFGYSAVKILPLLTT